MWRTQTQKHIIIHSTAKKLNPKYILESSSELRNSSHSLHSTKTNLCLARKLFKFISSKNSYVKT